MMKKLSSNRLIWSKKTINFTPVVLLFLLSCHTVSDEIEPNIQYSVREKMVQQLSSPFEPLSLQELEKSWATEYRMGVYFAKKLDLYRAITAFSRAEFLLSEEINPVLSMQRKHEVEYYTLLCYALGKRHDDLVTSFESSSLAYISSDFSAYHDLLILLGEAYDITKQKHKADSVYQAMAQNYPKAAESILIGNALKKADTPTAYKILSRETKSLDQEVLSIQKVLLDGPKPHHFIHYDQLDSSRTQKIKQSLDETQKHFQTQRKSPLTAQVLAALIPGAGYAYLGQYQSAFTAFSINALFISTSAYFFFKGNYPAGILTAGFESGWYFGSIYGSGQAANTYNERLYEAHVSPLMEEKKLHPLLQLEYGF